MVGALEVVGGQASARIADASKGHVKQTQRYRCSSFTSFNMRDFPFDSHELEFRFLCRSLGSSIRGRGTSRAFTCLHKPALTDESALRDHGPSSTNILGRCQGSSPNSNYYFCVLTSARTHTGAPLRLPLPLAPLAPRVVNTPFSLVAGHSIVPTARRSSCAPRLLLAALLCDFNMFL